MIKAIIFDLDGVLVETEKETFKFYQNYLKDQGVILHDKDFKYKAGRKSKDFWRDALSEEDFKKIDTKKITDLKRKIFNEEPEKYIKKVEGIEEILENLKKQNLILAVASQNELEMIETILNLFDIKKYFSLVLSINDVKELKPSPEIYLLALEKLNITASEALVVEDSKDGIASAKNAGLFCVGVKHEEYPAKTTEKADVVIKNLKKIDSELIKKAEEKIPL